MLDRSICRLLTLIGCICTALSRSLDGEVGWSWVALCVQLFYIGTCWVEACVRWVAACALQFPHCLSLIVGWGWVVKCEFQFTGLPSVCRLMLVLVLPVTYSGWLRVRRGQTC